MVDFVEICNVCARKTIIEAAKRIINFDKVCRSYSDLNFGVSFLEHSVLLSLVCCMWSHWALLFIQPNVGMLALIVNTFTSSCIKIAQKLSNMYLSIIT